MQQQQSQKPQSSNHEDQVNHSQKKQQAIITNTNNNIKHAELDCKDQNKNKETNEIKQQKKENLGNCTNEQLKRQVKEENIGIQSIGDKKVEEVVKEWSKDNGTMNDVYQKNPQLYMELLSMGFQQNLIKQAMKIHNNLDKSIEYIISKLQQSDPNPTKQPTIAKPSQNDQSFEDVEQEHKMIFLVRTDLKMGLGKIAAQVAHATLKAYKQMVARASQNDFDFIALEEWKEMGQKKIVVKVDGQAELLATIGKAKNKGINCCYIRDAGLTQVASGSITVAAIGPAPSSEIDLLTKQYKLL